MNKKLLLLITSLIFTQSLEQNLNAGIYGGYVAPQAPVVAPVEQQVAKPRIEYMNDVPDAVQYKPKKQNAYMAYEPAESFPMSSPTAPSGYAPERPDYIEPTPAELAIREIVNLDVDTKVKRDLIKIIKRNFQNERRSHMTKEEMMADILANQKIIIGLMTVLVAKLVVYDLYMEKLHNAETNK